MRNWPMGGEIFPHCCICEVLLLGFSPWAPDCLETRHITVAVSFFICDPARAKLVYRERKTYVQSTPQKKHFLAEVANLSC